MKKMFYVIVVLVVLGAAAYLAASALGWIPNDLGNPTLNSMQVTASGLTYEEVKSKVVESEQWASFLELLATTSDGDEVIIAEETAELPTAAPEATATETDFILEVVESPEAEEAAGELQAAETAESEDTLAFETAVLANTNGECWDWAVVNPGFETMEAWYVPITEYSAEYSEEQAFAGSYSMRTGIVKEKENKYSFSSASQVVHIPHDVDSATLTFKLYQLTTEPDNLAIPESLMAAKKADPLDIGDAQWVLILDKYGRELERLVSTRENTGAWEDFEFDLSQYAGRNIRIYFSTYNNGWGGVTGMYVDEVTLELCAGAAPPEPEPPPDPEPPAPVVCEEGIMNGGFENKEYWRIPPTFKSAEYSKKQALSGEKSLKTGIGKDKNNIYSYSTALQTIHIPYNAKSATLEFSLLPQTNEPADKLIPEGLATVMAMDASKYGDAQWVLILDRYGRELERLVSMREDAADWLDPMTFDLMDYRGWTVQIYFGTYNNGEDGVTAMFVDDVSLEVCKNESPSMHSVLPEVPQQETASLSSVMGRVTDGDGVPLEGITVRLEQGMDVQDTLTDADGYYKFSDLVNGTYVIIPTMPEGILASPPSRIMTIPPNAGFQDFATEAKPGE